ncbi:LptF/LptG family permease [Pacificibacter maritimus]|uniref:LptF/LptG family permease n=1 Tax=Pacificibacter maritimus TaxID=762213 RepID=UPI001475145D|nr:LptF/LptG family permease [Pacificibacter maritimus]
MLQQHILLFGLFSLILVMVFWVNKAVSLLDQLMSDGQNMSLFLKLTSLSLPMLIADVLPITAFIATVFAINRMSNDSELVVIQATGFSPWRLGRAVIAFGLIASLMVACLTHVLSPLARGELAINQAEMSRDVTARLLTEGTFVHPANGITFYVREINASGELLDVYLSDSRGKDQRINFLARRALIVSDTEGPVLLLFDGASHALNTKTQRLSVTTFDSFAYNLAPFLTTTDMAERSVRSIPSVEFFTNQAAVLAETELTAMELRQTFHERTSKALLAAIATIIGFAALVAGGFSRFGLWRQIFLAIGLLILLKAVDSAVISTSSNMPELWALLYVPSVMGFCLAGLILWYTSHPHLFRRRAKQTPQVPQ